MSSASSSHASPPATMQPSLTPPFLISIAVTGLLFALGWWAWDRLPADAHIAKHWNGAVRPNGLGARHALFIVPCVMLVLTIAFRFLPYIEPRRRHLLLSSRAYRAIWIAVVCYLSGIDAIMIKAAFDEPTSVLKWIGVFNGVFMVVVGNFLGKVRSNFLLGVRTPWTLSSELSWNRTNRLAGWLFVTLGIAVAILSLLEVPKLWIWCALIGSKVLLLVGLFVYSYCIWKKDPDKMFPDDREVMK